MREKLEQVCAELKGMGHGAALTMRRWPQTTQALRDLQQKAARSHATLLEVIEELGIPPAVIEEEPVAPPRVRAQEHPTPEPEPEPAAAEGSESPSSEDIFKLPKTGD